MKRMVLLGIAICCSIMIYSQTTPYSSLRSYSPYQSPYNISLMYQIARAKQEQVNQNIALIQLMANRFFEAIKYACENNLNITPERKKWLDKQVRYFEKNINSFNYSQNSTTASVANWLKDCCQYIYSWEKKPK